MKKIAMLMAPLLMFVPFLSDDSASEAEEITVLKMVDVPLYVVYKVDINATGFKRPDSAVHEVYFERNDTEGKLEFEYALRNGKPLPQGIEVEWNYGEYRDLTVYIFGEPLEMYYGYSNTYYQLHGIEDDDDGYYWSSYVYLTEDDILDTHSSTEIIAGQTVKITIQNQPDDVGLYFLSSPDTRVPVEIGKDNLVEIDTRGGYVMFGNEWVDSMPYITYTIEYKELPSEVQEYGKIFLVLGLLPVVAMIWFGRSQKIKD